MVAQQGLALDVRYFQDYPAQVAALLDGGLDTAWNTNLAHVRVLEQAPQAGALATRDTDRGWRSHLVVRDDSACAELALSFGLWSAFGLLAGFWLIGVAAGALWWVRGVEARGMSLEALATA